MSSHSKGWSLSGRIVAGVLVVVFACLIGLSLSVAIFTSIEVTERLDNSLQEVAERLDVAIATLGPDPATGAIARLPIVDRRTLAYQIVDEHDVVVLRSQNAPVQPFIVPLHDGLIDTKLFRVYVMAARSNRYFVLVGEPNFHRREAVRRAIIISVLPMLFFMPCIWLFVRWIVGRALRPLTDLQLEIRARGGANLEPIPRLDLPGELSSIHVAVNSLLSRLKNAVSSERAFAANAAHELRNPIAALLAQTQMLRGELQDQSRISRVDTILSQIRRIARTTERLLQLSRATAGVAVMEKPFDLVALLRMLVDDFAETFPQACIGLDPGDFQELRVYGDVDTTGIMFRNIIENAVNYRDPGTDVQIRVKPDSHVEVTNDCTPLATGILARLSEPFVRGSASVEGSGLGLAIAKAVAGQMGARLDLISPLPGQSQGFMARLYFPGAKSGRDA